MSSTVSLTKPVSLAKSVQLPVRLANPVCTVSLARRSTVSLAKPPMPKVSLRKKPAYYASGTEAMIAMFGRQDDLHEALGRTDTSAARDISLAIIGMEIAAADYQRLAGGKLAVSAAIAAAFASQDINTALWRMDSGKVVAFVEPMRRALLSA